MRSNILSSVVEWSKITNFDLFELIEKGRGRPVSTIIRALRQSPRPQDREASALAQIEAFTIDGDKGPLNARCYTPIDSNESKAGIVFFHGGGFVIGSTKNFDSACMRLSLAARCKVLSISYRLAPEYRFPAAHDDALSAWNWLIKNASTLKLDAKKLAVSGESAGGNLAAFLAQETARQNIQQPVFQLLFYPLLQYADVRSKKSSFKETGFLVATRLFELFRDTYVPRRSDRMDVRVSPLFAPPTDFQRLCPAHLVLCGWDPLLAEGRTYADQMVQSGIKATVREYPNMIHGFLSLTARSSLAQKAVRQAGEIVGEVLKSL